MSVSSILNIFPRSRATVPRLALCKGCGDKYNTLTDGCARARMCACVCVFSSMAARMQHHRAAHCAHMVSTDKAVSDPLPFCFFYACMMH